MNSSRLLSKPHSGVTLFEVMVATGILGLVLGVLLSGYVVLSRGFNFIMKWSDLNNNLCRVMDSVDQDLRNATGIVADAPSGPIQTLRLTVPQPYAEYFSSSSDRAGAPSTSGSVTKSGTILYSGSASLLSRQTTINRTMIWTGTGGARTAIRTVAIFPDGATLRFFSGTTTTAFSGTLNQNQTLVRPVVTGTIITKGTSMSSGTLQGMIHARAHAIISLKP